MSAVKPQTSTRDEGFFQVNMKIFFFLSRFRKMLVYLIKTEIYLNRKKLFLKKKPTLIKYFV